MHQITAYGGTRGPAPFQQAILQSAAWLPMPIASTQEEIYKQFLETAGVSTLQQARELSSEALQLVNYKMVGESPYGDFLFSESPPSHSHHLGTTYDLEQTPLSTDPSHPLSQASCSSAAATTTTSKC